MWKRNKAKNKRQKLCWRWMASESSQIPRANVISFASTTSSKSTTTSTTTSLHELFFFFIIIILANFVYTQCDTFSSSEHVSAVHFVSAVSSCRGFRLQFGLGYSGGKNRP